MFNMQLTFFMWATVVGPISSHAPARVQRQMRGNFRAVGGKRGVSFGVQRKIQRWQNQTMTSLVGIYL